MKKTFCLTLIISTLLFCSCNSVDDKANQTKQIPVDTQAPIDTSTMLPPTPESNTQATKNADDNSLHNGLTGNTDDAYEKIHYAFEGMPDIEKVKPLLEAVMTRDDIVINNDNVLKCANVLVVLKKNSKVGVTEMDILKDMYQTGSSSVDYATQAATSATNLEFSK